MTFSDDASAFKIPWGIYFCTSDCFNQIFRDLIEWLSVVAYILMALTVQKAKLQVGNLLQ